MDLRTFISPVSLFAMVAGSFWCLPFEGGDPKVMTAVARPPGIEPVSDPFVFLFPFFPPGPSYRTPN